MNTETRELPAGVKITKRARQEFADFTARIENEGLHVGQTVSVKRVTTDSRDIILTQWWEPAVILELRNFDALVQFQDGTKSSSGLGMKATSRDIALLEIESALTGFLSAPALAVHVIENLQADMSDGHVPSTVRTFSELHDFVDANEYLIDALEANGVELDSDSDEQADLCNRAMGMVNVWLEAK